jgi:hypothetical protein
VVVPRRFETYQPPACGDCGRATILMSARSPAEGFLRGRGYGAGRPGPVPPGGATSVGAARRADPDETKARRARRHHLILARWSRIADAAVVANLACAHSQPGVPSIQFVGNRTCSTIGQQPYFASSPANVNDSPPVGQAIDEMPHGHIPLKTQVRYNHNPPTSGCHYNLGYPGAPVEAGAYDRVVPPEYWVHNLEHGYIVVLYNCPHGCDGPFQQLRAWYRSLLPPNPSVLLSYPKVLILPWSTMSAPFAAVSWDWYDPMTTLSISEVKRFYANHVGQGPEPNAP